MGAVANLAPELFAGILADVPFVDALTTILDPSLPLTVIEWDEWGDPLHNPDVYAYMKSYSPYENVRGGATTRAILAVTSLNDTRVLYVEPAKWVARLRARRSAPTRCSSARWSPATAASAGATTRGGSGRSSSRGCSTVWVSRRSDQKGPGFGRGPFTVRQMVSGAPKFVGASSGQHAASPRAVTVGA